MIDERENGRKTEKGTMRENKTREVEGEKERVRVSERKDKDRRTN